MKKYFYKAAIYPLRLYWFLRKPTSFGVKAVIEREDGKVLFIRNTYGRGRWNFPGGRIDKDESPEAAVRREVFEEVGITLESISEIGSFVSTFEHKKDTVTVFCAKGSYEVGKVQTSEIRDYAWREKHDLPHPIAKIALKVLDLVP